MVKATSTVVSSVLNLLPKSAMRLSVSVDVNSLVEVVGGGGIKRWPVCHTKRYDRSGTSFFLIQHHSEEIVEPLKSQYGTHIQYYSSTGVHTYWEC